jgi:hypothetical protein
VAEVAERVREADSSAFTAALSEASPFEAASRLLIASQNEPGALADAVKATLHPILYSQLDAEMTRSIGMFLAFARNMTRTT